MLIFIIFAQLKIYKMIQTFIVRNFGSIRNLEEISFLPTNDDKHKEQYLYEVAKGVSLLKIGIVYGNNASGKTTLLKALSFYRHIMMEKPESKNYGIKYLPFLLDNHSRTEHSFMQMTFWLNEEKYILSIDFDESRIYEETLNIYSSKRPSTLYKRAYNNDTDHSEISFGIKAGIDKATQRTIIGNTTNNCTVMAAFAQTNAKTSKLNDVSDFFYSGMQDILDPNNSTSYDIAKELSNDKAGKKKRFLLDMLKVCDFNITNIKIEKRVDSLMKSFETMIKDRYINEDDQEYFMQSCFKIGDELVFTHKGENGEFNLDKNLESAGTNRFLNIAIVLYYLINKSCFIPIDEIETSIHYEQLSFYIRLFLANSKGSSQMLMTTHDINLLNEDYIRRDVVWFTVKDAVGSTTIKRLSSLGLHKTLSPYNAYRQGKLVDLPQFGCINLNNK